MIMNELILRHSLCSFMIEVIPLLHANVKVYVKHEFNLSVIEHDRCMCDVLKLYVTPLFEMHDKLL